MNRAPIGALRHRLRLEAPVDADDGAGGFSRSYRTVNYIWAQVSAISSNQQFNEQRFEQTNNYQIAVRWRADVVAGMRFVFRDRLFLIQASSDPDGRRRFLTCACEEIV
jgi:SPP1 family predicted phage head-tail adaptor